MDINIKHTVMSIMENERKEFKKDIYKTKQKSYILLYLKIWNRELSV